MNKLSKLTFFFVAATTVVLFNSVCFASRSGDLEYWQTSGLAFDINKHFTFTAVEEFRAGRHNGNPYLHNVDLGLVYKGLADSVDIGFNFKKEYEKDSKGKFRQENRPHLNVMFKGKVFDFDTSNRIRLEYRNREKEEDLFRLRNKATVKFPYKFTKLNLQPYVAEEVFLNLGENNINQNRLSSGFSTRPAKNIRVSVYYMWKTSKITGGWRDTNVIGTQIKFLF
jgi:hypothetical protein